MLNIFELTPNDQSVIYLGQIFGNVGFALSGTGPALLGNMFKIFNMSLLVLGTFIVIYTTIMSVLKTASEGKPLGQKWDSLWTPLRMVLGVGILMPTGSGYCAIQVIIMWLVVQGIGAADNLWKAVSDYAQTGTVSTLQYAPKDLANTKQTIVQQIFSDLVCQAAVTKQFSPQGPNAVATSIPQYDSQGTLIGYTFGRSATDSGSAKTPYECGCVCWGPKSQCPQPSNSSMGISTGMNCVFPQTSATSNTTTDPKLIAQYKAQGDSMRTLVPTLEILADYYASANITDAANCWNGCTTSCSQTLKTNPTNPLAPLLIPKCAFFGTYIKTDDQPCPKTNTLCFYTNTPNYSLAWQNDSGTGISQKAGSNFVVDAGRMIDGFALNYGANVPVTGNQAANSKDMFNDGWIFAGAFYYQIANTTGRVPGDYFAFVNSFTVNGQTTQGGAKGLPQNNYFVEDTSPDFSDPVIASIFQGFYTGAFGATNNGLQNTTGQPDNDTGPSHHLSAAANTMLTDWTERIAPNSQDMTNPIVKLQQFGVSLLRGAESLFWITFAAGIALSAISMAYEAPFGFTYNAFIAGMANYLWHMLNTGAFFLIAIFISLGGLFAVYTPLLPYMLFTFAAIGWFIAVIEAMVAGPIVAIGLLSPGGESEMLGRAHGAPMILLNIFLRPTLMVFGMMAGMLLSTVGIYMLNAAFHNVVYSITGGSFTGIIEGFLFIFAYASIVISILNKCFSLVHVLPDRTLRWIGGQHQEYGEEAMASGAKGQIEAGGGQLGSGGKGVAGATPQALGDITKAAKARAQEKEKEGKGGLT